MAENNVFTLDSGYLTRKKQQLMSAVVGLQRRFGREQDHQHYPGGRDRRHQLYVPVPSVPGC